MFFLFRAVFWIAVVAMLMPVEDRPGAPAVATIAASSETMARDVAAGAIDWCASDPARCRDTAATVERFGEKVLALSRAVGLVIDSVAMAPQATGSVAR